MALRNLYVTFWDLPTQYYIAKIDPYGLMYLFCYYIMFHCVSTPQLIYPFFSDGHFGCFQHLSNKNRTVMNFLYMISDEHLQAFSYICSQKWNFLVIVRYGNIQLYNIILNHFLKSLYQFTFLPTKNKRFFIHIPIYKS